MGTATQGLFGGQAEVTDRARMVASILEVTRELIGVRMRVRAIRLLEFHANDPMEARPAACRHTAIHHLTIQSMDKTKTRRYAASRQLQRAGVADECTLAGEGSTLQLGF